MYPILLTTQISAIVYHTHGQQQLPLDKLTVSPDRKLYKPKGRAKRESLVAPIVIVNLFASVIDKHIQFISLTYLLMIRFPVFWSFTGLRNKFVIAMHLESLGTTSMQDMRDRKKRNKQQSHFQLFFFCCHFRGNSENNTCTDVSVLPFPSPPPKLI